MGVKGNRTKKKKVPKIKMSHRELCFDLAAAKDTRFIEVPLGSVWLNYGGVGQADVITIKPSYTRFNLDIYECKVSRSDYLKDIKSGKYKKYLEHCNRLYFAVTYGIAKVEEIPENVGLIVRGENGWSTVKAAKKRDVEFSQEMLLSLLFFKGRIFSKRRQDLLIHHTLYGIHNKTRLSGFGKEIKNMILNYNNLESKFKNLLWTASKKIEFETEKEREEFEDHWEKLVYTYRSTY